MGQSFHLPGLLAGLRVLASPGLLRPSAIVPDVRSIDFAHLHAVQGVRAIALDKDNTLTAPYALGLHPPYQRAWAECIRVFGREGVVVVSNSVGTPDDPGGAGALAVEAALGGWGLDVSLLLLPHERGTLAAP